MDDLISRQAALNAMGTWDKFGCDPDGKLISYDDDNHYVPYVHYDDMIHVIKHLPPAQPERMTNRQWIDFLSAQFDISRTSAKEMLHGMMQWKKEDNFKKLFNGGQDEEKKPGMQDIPTRATERPLSGPEAVETGEHPSEASRATETPRRASYE